MVHKPMKNHLHTLLTLSFFVLNGCEGYLYTFNEQPVFDPPTLFTDYNIPDPALKACVAQAILDQNVTRANLLTNLNCSSAGIAELKGLEIFTGLTHINLDQNNLVEIKPLLFLPYPQLIDLEGNDQLFCADGQLLAKQVSDSVQLPSHCAK